MLARQQVHVNQLAVLLKRLEGTDPEYDYAWLQYIEQTTKMKPLSSLRDQSATAALRPLCVQQTCRPWSAPLPTAVTQRAAYTLPGCYM